MDFQAIVRGQLGLMVSWIEGGNQITVTRDSAGRPLLARAAGSRSKPYAAEFQYDASGRFLGVRGEFASAMFPRLLEEAARGGGGDVLSVPSPDGGDRNALVVGGVAAAQTRRQSRFTHTKVLAVAGETLAGNNRTYHYTATVEQSIPFDQVRLIFLNHSTAAQTIPAVAAAATSGLDMTVPTEPWVVGGSVVVPARSASGRPGIGFSAWLDCQSVPMTDGSLRRIMLRAQSPVTDPFTVTDQASVNFGPDYSKWDIDGRTFRPYYGAVGDNTTVNQSSFVPTLSARGPIFGWQLRTRGKVLTVAGVGPSTTQGSGETGYQLNSWLLKACNQASTPDTPVEYLNWGLGSQTTLGYLLRFQEACAAGLVPGIAVFQAATSNDGTPSASVTANSRKYVAEFLATCEQYGVYPVITTRNPNTTAAFNAEAVAIAKAYDAELLAMREHGVEVWDICTPLSNGADTIYYNPLYTTDGTHPNGAGHSRLAEMYAPRLRALAGL